MIKTVKINIYIRLVIIGFFLLLNALPVSAGDGVTRYGAVIVGISEVGVFSDVSSDYWAFNYIQAIKDAGITTGYADGSYGPDNIVDREQMAAFIIRALFGEVFTYSQQPYFNDVSVSSWAFKYIQKLKELGITTGCGSYYFCPYDNVTRDQMAAFLVRAKEGGEIFQYGPEAYFLDVPSSHWAFKYIQDLRELNITTGCGNNCYCPGDFVTRAQMAAFMARAFLGMEEPLDPPVPVVPPTPSVTNFSGNWQGTWYSSVYGLTGSFSASVVQQSSILSGLISVPDIGISGATLKGNIEGNIITFGDINETIIFTGTLGGESSASGTYVYPYYNDNGTWQGAKYSAASVNVTGTWTGGWQSPEGGSGAISIQLNQNGNSLSGFAAINNTDCGDVNIPITGTINGNSVSLSGQYSCEGYTFVLQMESSITGGNNVSGQYSNSVSGYGVYNSGNFTLSLS